MDQDKQTDAAAESTVPGRASQRSIAVGVAPPANPWTNDWLARHWQKLVAVSLWLVLIGVYVMFMRANDLGPLQSVQRLVESMQAGVFGSLLYFLLYALRPLIFFPATLLTVAGGFLFGPVYGIILTVAAANTSALVAYFVGRYFGQDLVARVESGNLIQRYATRMRANSFETILIMRFIFLPYDLVNYLAGFLRIDWRAFLLATALGSIPGTISFVLFGASIERFDGGVPALNPWVLATSALIFVASLVLARVFKRREQQTN